MAGPDSEFMRMALSLAQEAAAAGETPIGAVAVAGGKAVASARNRVEEKRSSSAHAELELLHELETRRGDWRMEDVTVYVTKEPCPMCAGALVNARVHRIVYGAADPRFGGCSVFGIPAHPGALFHPEVTGEVCAGEAAALLVEFFRSVRTERKCLAFQMRNYHDPEYIAAQSALLREVFGYDLEFWFQLGLWNEKYESCALFDAAGMIAHAGLFRLNLRVGGGELRAIELNCVACTPRERGKGHAARLIDGILRRYSGTPALLFADPEMRGFYGKFGFVPTPMHLPVAFASVDHPGPPPVRCAPQELLNLASTRRLPSAILAVSDDFELRCLHLFGDYSECLYRLAPGIAVAAEKCGETLKLHELFVAQPVSWERLAKLLPFTGIRRVEFGFCPDRLGVDFHWETLPRGETLFLRGDWDLPENFLIPEFSRPLRGESCRGCEQSPGNGQGSKRI